MFRWFDRLGQRFHARPPERGEIRSVSLDKFTAETLAHVAHELRQPLNAALAAFSVIRSSPHDQQRERAAAVIDRQLLRLARLIDDLVDATRMRIHRPSLRKS